MNYKLIKGLACAIGGACLFSGSVFAQESEVVISSAAGVAGSELSIPVNLTANNHDVTSVDMDILFDDAALELRAGGDACGFVNAGPAVTATGHSLNCSTPADGTLRILITAPFVSPIPPLNTGELFSIRMDIQAGAAIDTYPLDITSESLGNTDGFALDPEDENFVPGEVEVLETPPTDANLVIAPASHDFGTQDINDPAQTFDFTLSNDGVDDSLEIGTASVGGAPYSVSGNCDGETLAPGGTCVVTVTFDPAAAGSFADTLTVTSDVNTVTADLDGAATATANIVINPPFGPVNLGFGAPGDTLTANGTINNTGSESADVSCSLSGDAVFSTDPSPLAATVAPGATVGFSLSCALPADAEEGASFSGTLSCDIDGDFAGEHELSCGVSTFEPLPVPTMQAWALALFALMMLLAGAIGIRFFRA